MPANPCEADIKKLLGVLDTLRLEQLFEAAVLADLYNGLDLVRICHHTRDQCLEGFHCPRPDQRFEIHYYVLRLTEKSGRFEVSLRLHYPDKDQRDVQIDKPNAYGLCRLGFTAELIAESFVNALRREAGALSKRAERMKIMIGIPASNSTFAHYALR